ncbi:hypothetical protein [Hyalangium minutum]|nr:hypothetical protein [Hyalangium minutum]
MLTTRRAPTLARVWRAWTRQEARSAHHEARVDVARLARLDAPGGP